MNFFKATMIALAVILGCVALSIQMDDAPCLDLEPPFNDCQRSNWRG